MRAMKTRREESEEPPHVVASASCRKARSQARTSCTMSRLSSPSNTGRTLMNIRFVLHDSRQLVLCQILLTLSCPGEAARVLER